ncbi:MAG TPA: hypothetical protein VEJ46_17255 [Candidatus Acidoferrum sp.]|nr:hypothetical protein [Candidatus Acidoferrum sp.]
MTGQELRFEQWANFYVAISGAAATLLGLLFVVITFAAERGRKDTMSLSTYLTPTVVYFTSVLLTSTTLTIPTQTRLSAVICICFVGAAGLVYSASLLIRRGTGVSFYSRTDLFPYVVIPMAGYALMVAGSLLLLRRSQIGLDLAALGMLDLLAIAIRDSWAIAITITSSKD